MPNYKDNIEITANVLTIVVAIVVSVVLIQRSCSSTSLSQPHKPTSLVKGSRIAVPEYSWPRDNRTLVLALSSSCRFCTESIPFYRRLIDRSKELGVGVVAALPTEVSESVAYLSSHGIENVRVKKMSLQSIPVRGTPTIILLNERGEVDEFWSGRPAVGKENEVLRSLG
jgi:uncharacterized membrane protein